MADGFKFCPRCAEQIRAAAVLCRFCGHRFDSAAPAVDDDAEFVARREAARVQHASAQRRARRWLVAGWILVAVSPFALFGLALETVRARELELATAGASALLLFAGFACLSLYLGLRPRHSLDPCPSCRTFRVRRVIRPGIATSVKVLRCEDCRAELSRSGF